MIDIVVALAVAVGHSARPIGKLLLPFPKSIYCLRPLMFEAK